MDARELLDELKKGAEAWNTFRMTLPAAEVLDLSGQDLRKIYLVDCNLNGVHLAGANLRRCDMRRAKLRGVDLSRAILEWATLYAADLTGATLDECKAQGADLRRATLDGASLRRAHLRDVTFRAASLAGAEIEFSDLTHSILVETDFTCARLVGCEVYGCSAWRPKLDGAVQSDLIITRFDEAKVVIDDLEIAQFLNLLLDNAKVRNVLDSVTSRAVLLLGRFTEERKAVLNALSVALRVEGYVPIIFDFEGSRSRDLTETIQIIAGLVKFVIADISDPKSIPQELSVSVPSLPSVPVAPVCAEGKDSYALFEHWERYRNVLPVRPYVDTPLDPSAIVRGVIADVEGWRRGSQLEVVQQALRREQEARAKLEQELAKLRGR